MREGIKTVFAVIVPDTRVADATKRHRLDKQMHIDLVNGSSTERQTGKEMLDGRPFGTKEKCRERLGIALHFCHSCIEIVIRENWQQWTEDLVLHDWIVPTHRV